MADYHRCVILNPQAGSAPRQDDLHAALARLGEYRLFESVESGDARRFAEQAIADGCREVIAGGGDGTLNEVLNGLAAGFGRVRLGLLPLGTANDFARSVDVSAELEGAIDVLLAGRHRTIDLASVSSAGEKPRFFLNVATGGFSSLVHENLDQNIKDWWRVLGYAVAAVKSLPELEEFRLTLAVDDEPPVEVLAYNLAIANGRFTGGAVPVAPSALLDDGLLDVVIYKVMTAAQIAVATAQTLAGEHLASEHVLYRQARRVVVQSEPQFTFNTDGESTATCPLRFEVHPRALELIVGPAPAALNGG